MTATPAPNTAPAGPIRATMAPMGEHDGPTRLAHWQLALLALAGVGVAVYATAADYQTVAHLAAHLHVALAGLVPVGVAGGLYILMTLDQAAASIGKPIWWLRYVVLGFGAAVIAVNASAGWPSLRGMGIRMIAPTLLVVFAEGARAFLLWDRHAARRQARAAAKTARQAARIPRVRWVLAPIRTWRLFKLMHLWNVRSYTEVIDLEIDRRAAVEKLRARFGDGWENHIPGDVRWQLDAGVRLRQALGRVEEILTEALPLPAGVAPGVALSTVLPVAPFMALTMGQDQAPDGPQVAHEDGPADGPNVAHPDGPRDGPRDQTGDGPRRPKPILPPAHTDPGKVWPGENQDPDATAARDAYIASLDPGRKTLTDRDLAALFPGRSRNWGATRIKEVQRRSFRVVRTG